MDIPRPRSIWRPSLSLLHRAAAAVILLNCLPNFSHGAPPLTNDAPRPEVTVPLATVKPLVTADVNDPAWAQAVVLPPMTPSLGVPTPPIPLPETKVQLLWDADYLYVRFFCRDTDIFVPVHGRDAPIYQGDAVEVFLDPVGDAHQWVELEFNADNDILDQITFVTGEPVHDATLCLTGEVSARDTWTFLSWDMKGLRSQAARLTPTPNGQDWIVDMAIPAKELLHRNGLKQFAPMTLRGDFLRYKHYLLDPAKPRGFLPLNWSPVSGGRPHRSPAAFGYIHLEGNLPSGPSQLQK